MRSCGFEPKQTVLMGVATPSRHKESTLQVASTPSGGEGGARPPRGRHITQHHQLTNTKTDKDYYVKCKFSQCKVNNTETILTCVRWLNDPSICYLSISNIIIHSWQQTPPRRGISTHPGIMTKESSSRSGVVTYVSECQVLSRQQQQQQYQHHC